VALLLLVCLLYGEPMTLRQTERKYIELQEAIRKNDGVECSQLPDVFFPEGDSGSSEFKAMMKIAKAVCADCPIKRLCEDYARAANMQGIWGGTTYNERQRYKD
jgi:hypothetical protein